MGSRRVMSIDHRKGICHGAEGFRVFRPFLKNLTEVIQSILVSKLIQGSPTLGAVKGDAS
jgi:hypothetical protein